MLQSSKIEELFGQLKKKNADIYVQRAMKLKQTMTKRTRLLSFNLASMEFFIFSDRSMTGYETAVDFIQVGQCTQNSDFTVYFWRKNLRMYQLFYIFSCCACAQKSAGNKRTCISLKCKQQFQ